MKKIFFGLMLAAIAVGANAFTNAKTELKDLGDVYVWDGTAFIRVYQYNLHNCISDWEYYCGYVITAAGAQLSQFNQSIISKAIWETYIYDEVPKFTPLKVNGNEVSRGIYYTD